MKSPEFSRRTIDFYWAHRLQLHSFTSPSDDSFRPRRLPVVPALSLLCIPISTGPQSILDGLSTSPSLFYFFQQRLVACQWSQAFASPFPPVPRARSTDCVFQVHCPLLRFLAVPFGSSWLSSFAIGYIRPRELTVKSSLHSSVARVFSTNCESVSDSVNIIVYRTLPGLFLFDRVESRSSLHFVRRRS